MGIILKPFKWIGGLFLRAVLNPLSQALLILGVVFSVVVGVGSVLAGTFIMTGAYKLFATPCIALGCFFSSNPCHERETAGTTRPRSAFSVT